MTGKRLPKTGEVGREDVSREPSVDRAEVMRRCVEGRECVGDEAVVKELHRKEGLIGIINLGSNRVEGLGLLRKEKPKRSDRVVEAVSAADKRFEARVRTDPKFKEKFLRLITFDLDGPEDVANLPEHKALLAEVQADFAGQDVQKKEGLLRVYHRSLVPEHRRIVAEVILAGDPVYADEFHKRMMSFQAELDSGKPISEAERMKRMDAIYAEAVESSNDENLKKLWRKHKKEESGYSPELFSDKVDVSENDVPVEDKKEVVDALSDVRDMGIPFEVSEDGSVSMVNVGDNVSIDIFVYKDVRTNKYVYYLFDNYANSRIEVREKSELLQGLDRRHLDAYISRGVQKITSKQDFISEVPDSDISILGEQLIGYGKSRGYKVEGENKQVLDGLVKVLVNDDAKYSGFYRKVEALNKFLVEEEHIMALRKKLLVVSKETSVSELIEG